MKNTFTRLYGLLITVMTTVMLSVPVFAADNPATGDERGKMMRTVMILLIISAVLIAAFFVMSAKSKKKDGKKK